MPKAQWLTAFIDAFLRGSQHIMSERSMRAMALRQWESHQGVDPVDAARRWNSTLSRSR